MRFMCWLYEGKEIASLPLSMVDNAKWYKDHYANYFEIDAEKIDVVVRYVKI